MSTRRPITAILLGSFLLAGCNTLTPSRTTYSPGMETTLPPPREKPLTPEAKQEILVDVRNLAIAYLDKIKGQEESLNCGLEDDACFDKFDQIFRVKDNEEALITGKIEAEFARYKAGIAEFCAAPMPKEPYENGMCIGYEAWLQELRSQPQ